MDFSYNAPPVTTQKCELRQQQICGNSSVGRARPCQGRGREFESRFPLQNLKVLVKYKRTQAGIAQLVEHDLAKVGVASSSLVSAPNLKVLVKHRRTQAGIAQLVEHDLPRSGSRVRVSFPAPILIYSKIIHNEYRVGARFVPLSSDPCKQTYPQGGPLPGMQKLYLTRRISIIY